MNFYDYYKTLSTDAEKRAFRKQIIALCQIEPSTFYAWLNRRNVPKLAQKVIAETLGKSQKELFPN